MTVSKIVIFKGKHGDVFFDASTTEALHKAFLYMARSRDGLYYVEPVAPDLESMSYKEIIAFGDKSDNDSAELPEKFKAEILNARTMWEFELFEHEENITLWNLIRKVLDTPTDEALKLEHVRSYIRSDGKKVTKTIPLIEYVMEARRDYQYEGYQILVLDTPSV